jgi:hypothetical protein
MLAAAPAVSVQGRDGADAHHGRNDDGRRR